MAALRDQWQADRQARQQAVAQRRKAVQADLNHCQQVRQQTAVEQRQTLADYSEAVQAETNLYLAQVKQQRQAQARRTAAKLKEFDAELKETVAELRHQNQQQMKHVQKYVIELQAATHQELTEHQRDRTVMRNHQEQKLAKYVDELETSVSEYLGEVSEKRQTAAVQDRAQRRRDRDELTQNVQALRDDYAVYRQQMQAFRKNLRQSVWGDAAPGSAPVAADDSVDGPNVAVPAQPVTPPPTPPPVVPSPQAAAPPVRLDVPAEAVVYNYLQTHSGGARLTEIESSLGINRFEAVDALRSLIQKELIVQKGRIYHIQEEAVL
ncbi:MAG: hypothetical protein F6J95_021515 [Leptolyngbya sp. SIO1E4]|nr:hypothetical protein [Leptolyngbya sp. SIO1E4]